MSYDWTGSCPTPYLLILLYSIVMLHMFSHVMYFSIRLEKPGVG